MIDLAVVIAHTADLCRKPYQHAVVPIHEGDDMQKREEMKTLDDLLVRIETRDPEGMRIEEMDLELEIYRSGRDVNLMLSWCDQTERPMLWQGQHPVWMQGNNGTRCSAPADGQPLEAMARRLRAQLVHQTREE